MAIQRQKVQFFEEILADYYRKSGRTELPWRRKNISAYEVWVSEIMLQQTQVSRVIEYYTRFLKKYPTVQSLAQSHWEEFLPYYQGLGYYARGRNMIKTAQKVVQEHEGVFPQNREQLIALPGIGEYTAAAILSFGYGKNETAWDTNLKRVVGRFFYGSKKASIELEVFEQSFTMPRKKLNAALMDFGSSICTARPKCANCPLQKKCVYFQSDGKNEVTGGVEKRTFPTQSAAVLLFLHENHKFYYSSHKKIFLPFALSSPYNSRAQIKAFFLERFGLQLSVRPPHKYMYVEGVPTLLVNAQILAGKPSFAIFPKTAVAEFTPLEVTKPSKAPRRKKS